MIFPALLILLVSFCQGAPNPPTENNPYRLQNSPKTTSFMCLDSTVSFETDPRKAPSLLLSGLCNAARTTIAKITSAPLGANEKYQRDEAACKAARTEKRHIKKMVNEAYHDTMGIKR
ncbi:hypothetical protein BASA60_007942 [Batrachochytrium salamandrivorans]|nr:hypothetical protein BASA60_007942 [Batrachochytrium salamandrivorans]